MATIRQNRRARLYWLHSNHDKYRWQVLLISDCPACKFCVMEVYGVTWESNQGPRHRIKVSEHDFWFHRLYYNRLNEAELGAAKETMRAKHTAAQPHVSDFTILISRSTEDVYQKVLKRMGTG